MTLQITFASNFLSWNPNRCFNLVKLLFWFEADLQMLLMWSLKFSLSSVFISKSLTFDTALFSL